MVFNFACETVHWRPDYTGLAAVRHSDQNILL